jgi:hypothetical protein
VLAAVEFDHGPLVQWNSDPSTTARIRWIERAEEKAVEGRWASGPAGFGYGDGDDATALAGMAKRYTRVAIRRQVSLPRDVPADARLYLMANYDDALVAWIGGREVARRNATDSGDGGVKVPKDHEAGKWEEILLGRAGELLGRTAVLAIEGHNVSKDSSDFSLDVALVAKWEGSSVDLVAKGARWEYFAGGEPEAGWRNRGGVIRTEAGSRETVAALEYREKGRREWRKTEVKSASFAGTRHRVRSADLQGLPPGSEIELRLAGSAGSVSRPHRFRTAPNDAKSIRFVTGGDLYHTRGPLDAMNRRAGREDPLFALLGGDLAYTNDENPPRWFDFIDSWVENARTPDGRLVPMVVAIGNHEVKGAGYRPKDAPGPKAAGEFFSLFHMRRDGLANDCFDLGDDLSIVLLDSGHAATIDSQTAWLESVLAERRRIPQLFVCYHRPAWGCGTKDDAVDIQRAWCPLFEKFRVDAVFENDHHTFCRSHPLTAGKVDPVDGIPYLGSGAWGVQVRKVDPGQMKKRPWLVKADGVNHLYLVETGPSGWTATAKAADGKVIDQVKREWRR